MPERCRCFSHLATLGIQRPLVSAVVRFLALVRQFVSDSYQFNVDELLASPSLVPIKREGGAEPRSLCLNSTTTLSRFSDTPVRPGAWGVGDH